MEQVKDSFYSFIKNLQDKICHGLETEDQKGRFIEDAWKRPGGGGGESRVIQEGQVFEKGGVNVSKVEGELPELLRQRFNVTAGNFFATGISLVIHPRNPMVPTVHMNIRYFEMYDDQDQKVDAWFGGGIDLTPYYLYPEDAEHFHKILHDVCATFDRTLYKKYKKECDDYFWNHHRGEARGIGGIFFDYLRPSQSNFDVQKFTQAVGDSFLECYLPIVSKRKSQSYSEEQRYWQEIRRGRYVEFNLIHDRGTLFGLKTNGRTESILMSLPSRVRWDYNFPIPENSEEERLVNTLRQPVEWIKS